MNPYHFRVQELHKNEVRASHTDIGKALKVFFSQLVVIQIREKLSSDHPDSLLFVRSRILLSNLEGVEHTEIKACSIKCLQYLKMITKSNVLSFMVRGASKIKILKFFNL